MNKIKIAFPYCDSTGDTVYFTRYADIPVMTSNELNIRRGEWSLKGFVQEGAGGSNNGVRMIQARESPNQMVTTPLQDWYDEIFGGFTTFLSGWNKTLSDDFGNYVRGLKRSFPQADQPIDYAIKRSAMPYIHDSVNNLRTYQYYLKNDSGIYGPFTYQIYDDPGNFLPRGVGGNGEFPCMASYGSGSGSFIPRYFYSQIGHAFYVSDDNGVTKKLHYKTIQGYHIPSSYVGHHNAFGVSGVDDLFPPTPYDENSSIAQFFNTSPGHITDTDPYSPGGTSGPGGGDGTWTSSEDSISIPDIPSASASDTGFLTLFNPSASDIKGLAAYMWTGLFDVNNFRKILANPMDCILGLSILPVSIPRTAAPVEVKIGNISTGINFYKATRQFVSVDCGTLDINKYFGSYLDYSPYSKMEIYLPYIGTQPLDIDDVMGGAIQVVYHIDILTGACCAYVKTKGTLKYTYSGNCAIQIPITNQNWSQAITGLISTAGKIGKAATSGFSAPAVFDAAVSTAANVSAMKPGIERSGNLSGTSGFLGVKTPYLIYTRPSLCDPGRQNTFMGYPSFVTLQLGSLQGYTEVEEIHLENIHLTDVELSELEEILKGGFIA